MKKFGATCADTERKNEFELMLVAFNKEREYTVNDFVTGNKNVIKNGNNSDDDTLLTDDFKNNRTKVKAPGNEEFLLTATEEKLAFPVDARILDDPNV